MNNISIFKKSKEKILPTIKYENIENLESVIQIFSLTFSINVTPNKVIQF